MSHSRVTEQTCPKMDVVVVGGAGHVGLSLGLVLSNEGLNVCLYDQNVQTLEILEKGSMPFVEWDAEPLLKKALGKTLFLSSDLAVVSKARWVIVCIGTPVDEYLNPKVRVLFELFETLLPVLQPSQTIIIRSTVYPRTCQQILRLLGKKGGTWKVAYCPERTAQGYGIKELKELPQIVAGLSEEASVSATELFSRITPKVLRLSAEEAELAKLFSNAWRYIQFSVANQFYMMSTEFGVDYNRVRKAMVDVYGRAAGLPTAGFAAGPCLLKDTMQLSAFNGNRFILGHAAMLVNEGLPSFIVEGLKRDFDLSETRVGILGMAFKAEVDDIRDSLSYKLGKILRFNGAQVIYSDEYAKDPTFVSKEDLVRQSQIIIVGVPHAAYRNLSVPTSSRVVDLWNVLSSTPQSAQTK